MRKTLSVILTTMLAILAMQSATAADIDDDEAVKYRHNVYESIGAHMKSIVAILKGKVPYEDQLATHAEALATAATLTKTAMRYETLGNKEETTATAKIWENWDKFESGLDKLMEESQKLADIAQTGDKRAIGQQVRNLGQVCKTCHDNFREK